MNDPNGLIQWKGIYHLFYQYNPKGAYHDAIHWGHAASRDLVHWEHLPIALAPTPDGADKDGCWSGCAIDNHGIPTLLYTGVYPQVQCIATSADDLLTWQKYPQPVISAPPPAIQAHAGGHIRDPYVWEESGHWYMLLGSKIEGAGGLILLYRSDDLINWQYLRPLMAGDVSRTEPFRTGAMWECPNLLDFGEKRVLIISIQAASTDLLYSAYFTGTYESECFLPEFQSVLVYGGCFYAPQVMRAADGRYIMFGWIREGRSQREALQAGWAGVLSLPVSLSLLSNGSLALEPVKELEALRQEHRHFDNLEISPTSSLLEDVQGDALEIRVEFQPGLHTDVGIILRASPDGQDETRIIYQPEHSQLVIERSNPNPEVDTGNHVTPLVLAPGEPLNLHIFLDHSVIEVFANRRICIATRIYPAERNSQRLSLSTRNGMVKVESLDVWKLRDIWK
jgi:beta-fructofuranosidase